MNRTIITLETFHEFNCVDGHYAVWKTGKIATSDSFLYGFSGVVVKYTEKEGFKNYPDWMDETPENEMSIVLLSELPSLEQLQSGDF